MCQRRVNKRCDVGHSGKVLRFECFFEKRGRVWETTEGQRETHLKVGDSYGVTQDVLTWYEVEVAGTGEESGSPRGRCLSDDPRNFHLREGEDLESRHGNGPGLKTIIPSLWRRSFGRETGIGHRELYGGR